MARTSYEWTKEPRVSWPTQTVACQAEECPSYGIQLIVPAIGQDVVCGACSTMIVTGTGTA